MIYELWRPQSIYCEFCDCWYGDTHPDQKITSVIGRHVRLFSAYHKPYMESLYEEMFG